MDDKSPQIEQIKFLTDRMDIILEALYLPVPYELSARFLREALTFFSKETKSIYVELTGVNPWKTTGKNH